MRAKETNVISPEWLDIPQFVTATPQIPNVTQSWKLPVASSAVGRSQWACGMRERDRLTGDQSPEAGRRCFCLEDRDESGGSADAQASEEPRDADLRVSRHGRCLRETVSPVDKGEG